MSAVATAPTVSTEKKVKTVTYKLNSSELVKEFARDFFIPSRGTLQYNSEFGKKARGLKSSDRVVVTHVDETLKVKDVFPEISESAVYRGYPDVPMHKWIVTFVNS